MPDASFDYKHGGWREEAEARAMAARIPEAQVEEADLWRVWSPQLGAYFWPIDEKGWDAEVDYHSRN